MPGDEVGRVKSRAGTNNENGADEERRVVVDSGAENAGMCHRTLRAIVSGKLRALGVYVDCLNDAGQRDQQDAQAGESFHLQGPMRAVSSSHN